MRIGIVDFSHDIHLKIKEISIRWRDPEFLITRRLIKLGNILQIEQKTLRKVMEVVSKLRKSTIQP